MTSLMARGSIWLSQKQQTAAAETVTYLRAANTCEGLLAVPSNGRVDQNQNAETYIVAGRYDWIVLDTNAFRFSGDRVTPESGDKIQWVQPNNDTLIFEVNSEGDDVWEPSGPYPNRIRIHTKFVDTIAAT